MPRKRLRERIVWSPIWDKAFEGYAANFYRENQWRCDHLHSLQDLMQDAYLIFANCKNVYPRVVEPAHFMALYKRALANNMHDKALYKRRKDASEVYLSSDVSDFFVGRIGELSNSGYLAAMIAELPEELRMVLKLLASGMPPEPAEPRRRGLKPREGLSMQIRRLLRWPINSDPLTVLKLYLTT